MDTKEHEGEVVARMSFSTEVVRKDFPKHGTRAYETREELVPYGLAKALDGTELFKVYCGHEMKGIAEPVYGHHGFRFNHYERIIPLNPIPENCALAALLVDYEEDFRDEILLHTFNNGEGMGDVLEGDLVFKSQSWWKFELVPTVVKEKTKEEFSEDNEKTQALIITWSCVLLVFGTFLYSVYKIVAAILG